MAAQAASTPKPAANVVQLQQHSGMSGFTYTPTPNPNTWHSNWPSYWPYYVNSPDPDAGRLRFALELIAGGGLTKEAIEKIAKAALREKKG